MDNPEKLATLGTQDEEQEGYQGISIYLVQEQCLVIIVLCSDTQCDFFFIVSILSNRFTANKNDTRGPPKFVDNICLNKC
jgi:hypothetical protein